MFVRLLLGLLCVLGSAHLADASPFAYFGNYSGSGRVSAIDLNTNNISHIALPGAQEPYGVAVNSFGSRVYVTDRTNNKLFKIDTATSAVTTKDLVNKPGGLAVNTAGTRLYVANPDNGSVSMFDADSLGQVGDAVSAQNSPEGVAVVTVNPTTDRVYVTNRGSNSVSIYTAVSSSGLTKILDLDLNAVIPGASGPSGIAINPLLSRAYVANNNSSNVTIINTSSNAVVKHLAVGAFPFGVTVSPDGAKAYVTVSGADSVAVIDTATELLASPASIAVGRSPEGVALTPDGTKLLTVNAIDASLSLVNPANGNVATVLLGGNTPQAFGKFVGPEFVSITLNAGAFGSITPKDPITMDPTTKKILVPKGSSVGLNVTPITDFKIDTVTLDGAALPSPYTVNANSDKVVAATFVREKYNITVTKTSSLAGTVTSTNTIDCGSTCSASYNLNTAVTLYASPSPGWLFLGWTGAGCSGNTNCSITTNGIYADVYGKYSLNAVFKEYKQFQAVYNFAANNLTINAGASYTTDPSNSFIADAGKTISIKPAVPSTTLYLPTGSTTGAFTVAGGDYDRITIVSGTDAGTFIIQ